MSEEARTPLGIFETLDWLSPGEREAAAETIKKRGRLPRTTLLGTYKKQMFGAHFAGFAQRAMRESAHWSALETELFATFTAAQLQCDY